MEIWNFSTGREHHLVLEGCVFWMEANWGQYMNRSYCNYTTILFSGDIQVVKTCLDTTTLQSDEDPGTSDLGKKQGHKKAISFDMA